MTKTVLLALSLALLPTPRAAQAIPLLLCKAACFDEVATSCGFLRKAKYKKCRTAIYNACRRSRLDCDPPTTTTTTTRPPTTTTSSTTTTTTFRPPTTTTTTVPLGPHTGQWQFFGSLSEDNCPSDDPYYIRDQFSIVQQGNQFSATVASVPGMTLTGTWNDIGGYTLIGDGTMQGCAVRIVLVTDDVGNMAVARADAGVGLGVSCSAGSCRLIYTGSLTRL